jgi:hypothetical protein
VKDKFVGLERLPDRLRKQSISDEEVVLPLQHALEAIDWFEAHGVLVLGWEGWVKDRVSGRKGHGNAPQGTVGLQDLSVSEAAEICRETMVAEAARWIAENPATADDLYFCITPKELI